MCCYVFLKLLFSFIVILCIILLLLLLLFLLLPFLASTVCLWQLNVFISLRRMFDNSLDTAASFIVSAYRYIAITTLAIIAVFLVYLRELLIDLHQIYRHSSVPKTRLSEVFQLLSSSGFRARRRRDFFLSRCVCHGLANPSTDSHYHNLA